MDKILEIDNNEYCQILNIEVNNNHLDYKTLKKFEYPQSTGAVQEK